MNVNQEARRRAVALRKRFEDTGQVFSQDDYRLALRDELQGLGLPDEFSDDLAEQIDDEMTEPVTPEYVARLRRELELLRPYFEKLGPDCTRGQAIEAYYADHPEQRPAAE